MVIAHYVHVLQDHFTGIGEIIKCLRASKVTLSNNDP